MENMNQDQNNFSIDFEENQEIIRPAYVKTTNIKNKPKDFELEKNLGIYNDIKISIYEDSRNEGKLLRLIYFNELKNQFQIDTNTLNIFQKYTDYEIAFVSIIGQKSNGKSFIFDKILNLSGVKGSKFTSNRQKGIYIWSQPFKKRNIKIFLVDAQGFNTNQISNIQTKIVQILLFLSHSIIFNNKSSKVSANGTTEDVRIFEEMVKNTFNNFTYQNQKITKQNSIFAKFLYHLKRNSKSISKNNLSNYFSDYNCQDLQDALNPTYKGRDQDLIDCSFLITNCVSEKFIRHLSLVFNEIVANIEQKVINGISYNGNIMIKLIITLIKQINKKDRIELSDIFKNIVSELYFSAYNYCIITYSTILQEELKDEEPKSLDGLIQIFKRSSQQTLIKFHQFNLDTQFHKQYLQKLEEQITSKQTIILQINKKKTMNILENEFQFRQARNTQEAINNLKLFSAFKPHLDHGRQQIFSNYAIELFEGVFKNLKNVELEEKVQQRNKFWNQIQSELNKNNQKRSEIQENIKKQNKILNDLNNKLEVTNKKIEAEQKRKKQLRTKIQNINQQDSIVINNDQLKKKINQTEQKLKVLNTRNSKVIPPPVPVNNKINPNLQTQKEALKKRQDQIKKEMAKLDQQIKSMKDQITQKNKKK